VPERTPKALGKARRRPYRLPIAGTCYVTSETRCRQPSIAIVARCVRQHRPSCKEEVQRLKRRCRHPTAGGEVLQRAERRVQRQARYEELHRLYLSGLSAEAIAPAFGMSAIVVRRWLKAGGPPAHSKPRQPQPLDPHIRVLEDRWREGCCNASRLWPELRQGGFTGSRGPVARWVARRRHEDPPPHAAEVRRAAAWPVPSSQRCARWLTMSSDKLNAQEGIFIRHLAEMAPGLTRAGELATAFAALIQKRSKADPRNGVRELARRCQRNGA